MNDDKSKEPLPPAGEMLRLIGGAVAAQAIHVAARLGVADRLASGPRHAENLAGTAGAHAPSLHRLLRYLATLDVVHEEEDGSFSLTLVGDTLRSDSPFSLRAAAVLYGSRFFWQAFGDLHHTTMTGRDAFTHLHGVPLFDHLARHRDDAAAFEAWMTRVSEMQLAAVLASYDFSGFSTLVDVGGGRGTLLAGILAAYPALRGVLFEASEVVKGATWIDTMGGRCERIAGSFFDAVPGGADAYLLQHVLHDWNDEQALRVLRNCRRVCTERTTLLVIEMLVGDDDPHQTRFLDLVMMSLTGGRERSEAEFADLLRSAGFELIRSIPIGSPLWILEGAPV